MLPADLSVLTYIFIANIHLKNKFVLIAIFSLKFQQHHPRLEMNFHTGDATIQTGVKPFREIV